MRAYEKESKHKAPLVCNHNFKMVAIPFFSTVQSLRSPAGLQLLDPLATLSEQVLPLSDTILGIELLPSPVPHKGVKLLV